VSTARCGTGSLTSWSYCPVDWVLVGGLMVQLHALERGLPDVRATRDIDVLGQARPQGALPAITAALRAAGFRPEQADLDNCAFRYVHEDLVVDVLAPDGLNPAPMLDASRKAIGIPGGSQALARAETVLLRVGGRAVNLRRPTLVRAWVAARRGAPLALGRASRATKDRRGTRPSGSAAARSSALTSAVDLPRYAAALTNRAKRVSRRGTPPPHGRARPARRGPLGARSAGASG